MNVKTSLQNGGGKFVKSENNDNSKINKGRIDNAKQNVDYVVTEMKGSIT